MERNNKPIRVTVVGNWPLKFVFQDNEPKAKRKKSASKSKKSEAVGEQSEAVGEQSEVVIEQSTAGSTKLSAEDERKRKMSMLTPFPFYSENSRFTCRECRHPLPDACLYLCNICLKNLDI